jgi:iron complex transport system substrate-binding protein
MRAGAVNGIALAAAIGLSVALAGGGQRGAAAREEAVGSAAAFVADDTGFRARAGAYRRIASGSTVADRLLLELCDPERVIAFARASTFGPDGHRYAARAHIDRLDDVERIVALRPDLLLVHNVADARRVQALREAGLTVFDLGRLEGVRSLDGDVRRITALCGAPERAAPYLRTLHRRLDAIARHLPERERRSAIYLTIYSGALFGGTRGSSYHDALVFAGLRDAAAERYRGWPQYSAEQLLELDPDAIVTRRGMRRAICGRPSLAPLRACRSRAVFEVDGALLDAPGPGILEAAEAVHEAVYE